MDSVAGQLKQILSELTETEEESAPLVATLSSFVATLAGGVRRELKSEPDSSRTMDLFNASDTVDIAHWGPTNPMWLAGHARVHGPWDNTYSEFELNEAGMIPKNNMVALHELMDSEGRTEPSVMYIPDYEGSVSVM